MIEKIRLDFEEWYKDQKFDQIATWHPVETLELDTDKYPNGRYTVFSVKQMCWEVWQAAFNYSEPKMVREVFDTPNGAKVKVCYMAAPLTPHNSSRNHTDIESEDDEKVSGLKVIPEVDSVYWTAEQILEYMVKNLQGNDIIEILKCEKESDMIKFHSSVGRWIRNTFKLWDSQNPHLDGMHPDEMSTEILKGVWRAIVLREHLGM